MTILCVNQYSQILCCPKAAWAPSMEELKLLFYKIIDDKGEFSLTGGDMKQYYLSVRHHQKEMTF